eukprot:CAMPEP_0180159546 /NCGR_PEP_ID=MMETSP0986-20121125/27579_1 /TAXON_ID=697907 /ORGANISM="non described non described, Strain CCMP2293" /LENGTH=59 /DNA_ID=CAMNT_0022109633 /DNA_START=52 /DNA_END=231 /DNA_ORIENTATION=-
MPKANAGELRVPSASHHLERRCGIGPPRDGNTRLGMDRPASDGQARLGMDTPTLGRANK